MPHPVNHTSDQHLISPYRNITESFTKIIRTKEVIANQSSFDCSRNSPCLYQRKCIENSMENMDTDVRVERANTSVSSAHHHKTILIRK